MAFTRRASTKVYYFGGISGDVPVTGDWDGSGRSKIGIYRSGAWLLDVNGDGAWEGPPTDYYYNFGDQLTSSAGVPHSFGDAFWISDYNGLTFMKLQFDPQTHVPSWPTTPNSPRT
jgi:hypothetical protein